MHHVRPKKDLFPKIANAHVLRMQKRLSKRASNARTHGYNKTISILSISDSPLRFCSIRTIRMNMDDARNTSVD